MGLGEFRDDDLLTAGDYALESLEIICWAERDEHVLQLQASVQAVSAELRTERSRVKSIAAETRSLGARKASLARHRENRQMKQDVFIWCDSHRHEYPSMDRAAEAVAGKVVSITFRTASDWIREWNKRQRQADPKLSP